MDIIGRGDFMDVKKKKLFKEKVRNIKKGRRWRGIKIIINRMEIIWLRNFSLRIKIVI